MMLGKTAGGLFWMFRYLERSENLARLVDAGFRMALTRSENAEDEWRSVISTAGVRGGFSAKYDSYEYATVVDYVLRDKSNPSSVLSVLESARNNARLVRTALTREVWEATNETWINIAECLSRPVREKDLPSVLAEIRHHSALVRGALHGTMLRNEVYNFCRLGTFLERADNTARILDVKYYVLLPSAASVGSSLDNVQWETVLRSVSALNSFRWLHKGKMSPRNIAQFLILERIQPRSLAFCMSKINDNLGYLAEDYLEQHDCHAMADGLNARLRNQTINDIFDHGLHEFISNLIRDTHLLGRQIETDYRFIE